MKKNLKCKLFKIKFNENNSSPLKKFHSRIYLFTVVNFGFDSSGADEEIPERNF